MTRLWEPQLAVGQVVTGSVVFGDVIQITGVGGDVTINLDRPPYRVVPADNKPVPVSTAGALSQPSRLLLARHQVVPFTGRDRTLDELAAWTAGDVPVAALLVHGAGGQGKTRLAAEVTTQCAAAGWAVWQVAHTPTPVAGTAPVSRAPLPAGAVRCWRSWTTPTGGRPRHCRPCGLVGKTESRWPADLRATRRVAKFLSVDLRATEFVERSTTDRRGLGWSASIATWR